MKQPYFYNYLRERLAFAVWRGVGLYVCVIGCMWSYGSVLLKQKAVE